MYESALRGYEAALGADNIMIYIPALNTLWGLSSLFKRQAGDTRLGLYIQRLMAFVGPWLLLSAYL